MKFYKIDALHFGNVQLNKAETGTEILVSLAQLNEKIGKLYNCV